MASYHVTTERESDSTILGRKHKYHVTTQHDASSAMIESIDCCYTLNHGRYSRLPTKSTRSSLNQPMQSSPQDIMDILCHKPAMPRRHAPHQGR